MHALLEEINGFLGKIKAGTASVNELEAFAAATQQLNERAIILKYKAYEMEVYGSAATSGNDNDSVNEHPSATSAPVIDVEETEKTEESVVPSHTSPKNTVEPIMPSTPVSQPDTQDEEELSFDLFSMEDPEEEVGFENNSQSEDQASAESDLEETQSGTSPFIEEKDAEIIDEPAAATAPEIKETPKVEPAATPAPAPTPVSTPSNEHPVLRRARTNDGSLQSRLLSVRLETLKNAFGLNERILIVKELFGGDNDLYNSTIEELDSAGDIAVARTKMNALANQYGWREDSELAIEFVQKVERRYA